MVFDTISFRSKPHPPDQSHSSLFSSGVSLDALQCICIGSDARVLDELVGHVLELEILPPFGMLLDLCELALQARYDPSSALLVSRGHDSISRCFVEFHSYLAPPT